MVSQKLLRTPVKQLSVKANETSAPDEVRDCFESMLTISDMDNDFLVYSRFFYLLGKIQETNVNGGISADRAENMYIERCLDFIHINYYRKIGVRDMCMSVGLEYSYLFRLFKQHVNTSPGKYLSDYRLSRAAYLLKNTGMSINEVACAVGYEDRAAFSKAFSRKYYTPPSAY